MVLGDAYGQELWNCYRGLTSYEVIERDDGLIDPGSASPYFQEHEKWPAPEREAIRQAGGTVLDIGCGAGRVALYLQQRAHKVVAIDNSPLAVKVCRLRGVKGARLLSIENAAALKGPFQTVVLYGNNFGLLGGRAKARRLLQTLDRITAPGAAILATTVDPYRTRDPLHLAYHQRNRDRGRMAGQIRMRIRYRDVRGPWFDYLLVSAEEMREIVSRTAWQVAKLVESDGPLYTAILRKR